MAAAAFGSGAHASGDEVQVTLKFITKLPAELRVPETPVTVPANLTRYGLSQIINHLLDLDPSRPFDFLVQGELLRLSLHKHLLAVQLSAEAVLEVEYVPAVLPPQPKEDHAHEDWVSCAAAGLDPTRQSTLTGCYDGLVRLWVGGEAVSTLHAHKGPVKAVAAVPALDVPNAEMFVTAGDDCVARVWLREHPQTTRRGASVQPQPQLQALLKGHSAAVEAAAPSPSGTVLATGGWDGKLLMWRSGDALLRHLADADSDSDDAVRAATAGRKKRKTGGGAGDGVPAAPHEAAPLGSLEGHSQCVSAAAWLSESTVASASWDHSVRVWDAEARANTETLAHNKAIYCLAGAPAIVPGGSHVVALGGPERAIRVWDCRGARGEGLAVRALASHTDTVAALAWHPSSSYHLLSASYDGSAKLWDLRASIPLHTVHAGQDKLLACCWVGASEVAVGGADCKLHTAHAEVA